MDKFKNNRNVPPFVFFILYYNIKNENVNAVVLWCKQNIARHNFLTSGVHLRLNSVGLTSGRRGECHFFAVTIGDNSGTEITHFTF